MFMRKPRPIELLAPAKNPECAFAAVDHGADAVYIGAGRFGARASAGNSLADIASVVQYAHRFGVKVYVTVNTLLRDDELSEAERLIWELYRIGVDALIVQDMGLLACNLPPIALHASTQMDNRTPEKVTLLHGLGFSQVVLARELSLDEIARIHKACDVPLEVFVHGALCVSYSGQCYVSQHCFGRSANRGECAQFCRLKFDLLDRDGQTIVKGKHLLSLKDLNQSDELEHLLDAGATSLKIEGRLKDVTYVKNITAYYRRCIDAIIKRRPDDYCKASSGTVELTFTPRPEKSFNRGFTHYFLHGRTPDIFSFNTPKSVGEEVGIVKEIRGKYMVVSGVKPFTNGDGLCYFDAAGNLHGFRVNRVENNKIYPAEMPDVPLRTRLFRNYDKAFEGLLEKPSGVRRIHTRWIVGEYRGGFTVEVCDEDGNRVTVAFPSTKELARTPQQENIKAQLSRLGNTVFVADEASVQTDGHWFVPSSVLAEWRRVMVTRLESVRRMNYVRPLRALPSGVMCASDAGQEKRPLPFEKMKPDYTANVMNSRAEDFYRRLGAVEVAPAFELEEPRGAALMFCRHCLKYAMGWCERHGGRRSSYPEPYYLLSADGRRFRLLFDCVHCQMKVYEAD